MGRQTVEFVCARMREMKPLRPFANQSAKHSILLIWQYARVFHAAKDLERVLLLFGVAHQVGAVVNAPDEHLHANGGEPLNVANVKISERGRRIELQKALGVWIRGDTVSTPVGHGRCHGLPGLACGAGQGIADGGEHPQPHVPDGRGAGGLRGQGHVRRLGRRLRDHLRPRRRHLGGRLPAHPADAGRRAARGDVRVVAPGAWAVRRHIPAPVPRLRGVRRGDEVGS